MEIKFFKKETIKSGQDVKAQYKELIKKYHPDVAGNTEEANTNMKQINAEYEYLLPIADKLEEEECKRENKKKTTRHDINDGYREIIQSIIFLNGIKIEIMGSWIWVSGNTYQYYNLFKGINFKWSKNKKAYYWYKDIEKNNYFRKGHYNLNQIRSRYGSTEVESEADKVLTTSKYEQLPVVA